MILTTLSLDWFSLILIGSTRVTQIDDFSSEGPLLATDDMVSQFGLLAAISISSPCRPLRQDHAVVTSLAGHLTSSPVHDSVDGCTQSR